MNGRDEGGNVITRKDVRENDGGGEPSLWGKHQKQTVREKIPKYVSERNSEVKEMY
jgi:hypothetical protein